MQGHEDAGIAELAVPVPPAVMLPGHASREGTERLARRFSGMSSGFYRHAQTLSMSSLGIGTYRGAMDRKTDDGYTAAIERALQCGVNLIDTSLNYRQQRSERAVGAAVHKIIDAGASRRDEIVICTKGGFVVDGAITDGTLYEGEVVGGMHSMTPAFLADQIDRSRRNLGLETIDVYYLHNPETQLGFVSMPEFMDRIRSAFAQLERAVADGFIRYYGTATWDGYRGGELSLRALADVAREIAGENHHFRFVQLPFNLGMQEALTAAAVHGGVLDQAMELGIMVIASASLLQGRLSKDLPALFQELMPGLHTDAQRSIQFTRSTPGIVSALVGMSEVAHVTENLGVARVSPLSSDEYQRLRSVVF